VHEAVDALGADEKAQGYALGLAVGRHVSSFELALKVLGKIPEGRGARHSWTFRVAKLDGLVPLLDQNVQQVRDWTPAGASPVFERIPLLPNGGRA
jgi:hypothetical protein